MDIIKKRILVCNLIEKMAREPQFSRKLGLKNESVFIFTELASQSKHFGENNKEEQS